MFHQRDMQMFHLHDTLLKLTNKLEFSHTDLLTIIENLTEVTTMRRRILAQLERSTTPSQSNMSMSLSKDKLYHRLNMSMKLFKSKKEPFLQAFKNRLNLESLQFIRQSHKLTSRLLKHTQLTRSTEKQEK